MREWIALALTGALIAAGIDGCAPSKHIERTPMNLSVGEVLSRIQERNRQIRTLSGDGSITVESPEMSNSGSFEMKLKKPDSLCIDLSGPFGIRVGTLQLSRETFVFYNRMDNTAVVGKPDGETMNGMFRLHLQFDEILRAFTGEFPSPSSTDSLDRFAIENDHYLVRYRTGGGEVREYRIDPNLFIVTSYRVLDEHGKPTLTAIASDIDDDYTIAMPRLLRVIFPRERRSVSIAYGHVEFNEPLSCSFSVPSEAEVIHR